MTETEIREIVRQALSNVAPEVNLDAINPEKDLRDQIDIDSVDFLNFVIGLHKELKVDMRSTPLLRSHTALTAMQEVAALILAYAVLVDYRIEAASVGEVGVLRISFLKTIQIVQGLWGFLEVSADLMTAEQLRLVVRRTLRHIADMAIPKRRQRSCPRALRQPVSGWPRLRKNTSRTATIDYSVGTIYA